MTTLLPKLVKQPDQQAIQHVHQAIKPYIHRTPVLTSSSINSIIGAALFFKCENFQKIGAFKMRGAMSAVLTLTATEKSKGIATHSSGNHAQAVALAAKLQGIPAYIVMPKNSPGIKQKATKAYGAEVLFCENTLAARETTLNDVVARTGATFIHPFDNYHVIAGQATAAKELLEEIPNLDIIIAPIGGGGLMSGTALYARYARPKMTILGSEPTIVNDAFLSLQHGQIIENTSIDTIADGLRTNLSHKTFAILRTHLDEIITVTETEIIAAMQLIWERMKIIIEPSSAVPFAAIIKSRERWQNKRIGIILTGGNVDLGNLPF